MTTPSTSTLNAASGGDKVLVDSALGTLDGATPPTGALAQIVELASVNVPFSPGYSSPDIVGVTRHGIDPDGHFLTRGPILTDEGTFRINFANTSLAVAIGSVTVAGKIVTGTGFSTADVHKSDYFKVAADADTAYVQIDSIDSDTQLTLAASYSGTASGTGNRALMLPFIGTGGSIAVASGQATITSGTTIASVTGLKRLLDYAPLVCRARLSINQRIANQAFLVGLREDTSTPRYFARMRYDGTTNTTLICETGRNPTGAPSASEQESTTVTIPYGLTSASAMDARVEVLTESVRFYVGGIKVAEHVKVIPQQYDEMAAVAEWINAGSAPATTSSAVLDYITGKNHNKLEVGLLSDAEQIVASAAHLQAFNYNVAGVITINTDLLVLDCSQLRSLFVQCTSMGTTGVVTVQWCNEPTFATPITATFLNETGASSTTINAAGLRVTNVLGKYCRIRLTTATTANATTFFVWGSQTAYVPIVTTQPVSGTVSVTGYPTAAASADASANPTITQIAGLAMLFNGTTWDRARGMSGNLTTGDTGAKTATGNGATVANVGNKGVQVLISMGAVTGTTPTAVLKLQGSTDGGTSWYDIPGATTASLTATGLYGITVYPGIVATAATTTTGTTATVSMVMPRTWRVVWTIGGTTPSFTITAIQYNYLNN
jgi:hypothetical protein